jgi:hypothetical protein
MRLYSGNNAEMSNLRGIITGEKNTAQSWYRASLDYLLCELFVLEGRYSEALAAFLNTAEQYKGGIMEVEILARVASIYGDLLLDKAKAKEYADKAASINPGQPILLSAYASADISYDPWKYTDKFLNESALPQTPGETDGDMTDYVTIYPNPANPVTTIAYSIKNPSNVRLSIYSINGQKVATLVDGPVSAGAHAVTFDGSKYASGVYFYRFESAGLTRSGKMLLLK